MQARLTLTTLLAAALLSAATCSQAADPVIAGFRGNGTGNFGPDPVATVWGGKAKTNILWTAPVGESYSCPVVVKTKAGDRILITSEPDKLVCVDKATGKVLWEKANPVDQLPADLKEKSKEKELPTQIGFTTPTPVSDGEHVWAIFGTGVVACYDMDGNRQWITWLDRESYQYGRSSSPALAAGVLLVPFKSVTGLDAKTGKVLWHNEDAEADYASLVTLRVGTLDLVATTKGDLLRVKDGKRLADGLASAGYATPVVDGDVIYYIAHSTCAVKITPKGADDIATKELWSDTVAADGDVFSSPVVLDGKIYTSNLKGVVTVLDTATGKLVKGVPPAKDPASGDEIGSLTLKIDPAGNNPSEGAPSIYASLTAAGGKVFIWNTSGDCAVLQTKPEIKEIQDNSLDGKTMGTPVFDGGRMYVRANETLYCIGEK